MSWATHGFLSNLRQKFSNGFNRKTIYFSHYNLKIRTKLTQKLATEATGITSIVSGTGHRTSNKIPGTFTYGLDHGSAFSTNTTTDVVVFDIAAAKDASVSCQNSRPYIVFGIGCVGPGSGIHCHIQKLLIVDLFIHLKGLIEPSQLITTTGPDIGPWLSFWQGGGSTYSL